MTPRTCEPCAEPGCPAPAARGSYCGDCAARYYVAPRRKNHGAVAAYIERAEASGHWKLPGHAPIDAPDFDTLDDGLRARRAAARVAAVRDGG